jgi:DNA-binding transcriptional LysR family regulator
MSRLTELQTFIQIVDAGSITVAAERLDVAKSAVSRRLSELEARLGVQLLKRTTRRMTLTEPGRSFYNRGLRILEDLDEAELSVSQEHCELAGSLRVAVPLSFGLRHLASAVFDFLELHPDIEFDLDLNDRQVDLLSEGFDLAIRIANLEDSSLIARRIATIQHVVCASPSYLASHGTPQTPHDLEHHRCLVYSHNNAPELWHYQTPNGKQETVRVPVTLRASSGDFLEQAAVAGRGIIMEPDFIVHQTIRRGDLIPLLTDLEWPSLNVYAIYPPTRFLPRRVLEFMNFLSDRFSGEAPWSCAPGPEPPKPG